jgi:hypothetical protein
LLRACRCGLHGTILRVSRTLGRDGCGSAGPPLAGTLCP